MSMRPTRSSARQRRNRVWRGLTLCVLAAFALAGCERGMHEMYQQPLKKPLTPSSLWADGNSSRPQVPNTVPHSAGADAGTSSGRLGRTTTAPAAEPVTDVNAAGKPLAQAGQAAKPGFANPLTITPRLLARGRQRFNIYCAPCHGRTGNGNGMIARRGFPNPPSYHTPALRNAADSHFYQVISDGFGVMYSYADRVSPHDRWAIVAYIRALQLSQHAPRSDLDHNDLEELALSAKIAQASTSIKAGRSMRAEGGPPRRRTTPARPGTARQPGGAR